MVSLDKMYTYEELTREMAEIGKEYSDILRYDIIGRSHDNRDIAMLTLGQGSQYLICTGGVHGRESVNPAVLIHTIAKYCKVYRHAGDQDSQYPVYHLLTRYAICFIPLLNPDGYSIALEGFEAIHNPTLRHTCKMLNIPHQEWKFNGRGVDINRNFPCVSYMRQGLMGYPGSENETKILMDVFRDFPSVAYQDFHSRGKLIYYHRSAMPPVYNKESYKLALYIQVVTGYMLGTKEDEFETSVSGGNTVNYYSEYYKKPAITIETVEDEAVFPLVSDYQEETFKEIYAIPLITLLYLGDHMI